MQPTRSSGNCVVRHDGEVNYQAARVQLRYQPSDRVDINININIIADYTHDDRQPAAGVLIYANNTSNLNIRGNADAVPYASRFIGGRFCNYGSNFSPADTWLTPPAAGYPLLETRNDGRTTFDGWGVSL